MKRMLFVFDPALVALAAREDKAVLLFDGHNLCVRCGSVPTIFYEYLDGPSRVGCKTCEDEVATAKATLLAAVIEQARAGGLA